MLASPVFKTRTSFRVQPLQNFEKPDVKKNQQQNMYLKFFHCLCWFAMGFLHNRIKQLPDDWNNLLEPLKFFRHLSEGKCVGIHSLFFFSQSACMTEQHSNSSLY